ncbi:MULTISPECIES: esterase/lipase family protein [Neobacillus]|uniref:triacylglycerol lipase n=1 Tax=Neobacillus rhizophilus TaxID=2833579 RepID=A0A942YWA7_9BACI|nr:MULTISPECIES: lipase [Neobacillus]MBS4213840.1 lipase [Neobacillus rhizophilus]MBU8917756.1 lipase [Bacillus sp. FJAT-29953]
MSGSLKMFPSLCPLTSLFFMQLSGKTKTKPSQKLNDFPIILVHGLTGWGRDEMGGIKYWGGVRDLEEYLNEKGHKTYTATVGPVSSNWDRAVELYAYIKGGKVDYGAAHAKEHGHERFGRTYPGIYSQWDATKKIHLVGHSMGGQTIRTLVELLENGSAAEREYFEQHPEDGLSDLFKGGKSWVHSVTTLATPHNGSTVADEEEMTPWLNQMVFYAGSLSGASDENIVYDYKLDQWGLKREEGESYLEYVDSVFNSAIWTSKDSSLNDLTTYGAAKLNHWVKTHQNVYYFSYTGDATYKGVLTGRAYPMFNMNPLMKGSSMFMGAYSRKSPEPVIDSAWWPNDGIVNVVSSKYPLGHAHKGYDGYVEKGVWNHFAVQPGWDHFDFIGIGSEDNLALKDIYSFYKGIADNLQGLPE